MSPGVRRRRPADSFRDPTRFCEDCEKIVDEIRYGCRTCFNLVCQECWGLRHARGSRSGDISACGMELRVARQEAYMRRMAEMEGQ